MLRSLSLRAKTKFEGENSAVIVALTPSLLTLLTCKIHIYIERGASKTCTLLGILRAISYSCSFVIVDKCLMLHQKQSSAQPKLLDYVGCSTSKATHTNIIQNNGGIMDAAGDIVRIHFLHKISHLSYNST